MLVFVMLLSDSDVLQLILVLRLCITQHVLVQLIGLVWMLTLLLWSMILLAWHLHSCCW